jgi:hypothetical protein
MPHRSYVVTSLADTTAHGTLRSAIIFANAHPGTTVTFAHKIAHHTITLSQELPLILGNHTVIDGGGAPHLTISGNDQFRVFFVGDTTGTLSATIENLTISHGLAKGGNGGGATVGGGGGAGLGGAIFVSTHASLAISGLMLADDTAAGGNGGAGNGGPFAAEGGGGGMGGNGGAGVGPPLAGGGGGGFGAGADGGSGSLNGSNGLNGQFTAGASGGNASAGSGIGGAGGGGGAGGSSALTGGGGGGVGGAGGGGGTNNANGGNGGFGGGGGGGEDQSGAGGFGGGAGGGDTAASAGGFGGGGGGSLSRASSGGFGGGSGSVTSGLLGSSDGGGGAGMGGAIFAMDGGSLTVQGIVTIVANTALAGIHSGTATDGSAFGAGLFLNGNGTIRFRPANGRTEHVFDAIDDEAGVVANGYTPPGGLTPGSYNLVKSGLGILILSADNAYSGASMLRAGTLIVNGSIAHSATTVDSHATLAGHGATGDVAVLGGGILSPGPGTAILHTGNVVLDPHAHFAVQLGGANPGQHGYDQLDVTGTVNLAGAKLDLSLLASLRAHKGETFEIISNDGSDPITSHFAGLAEGADFAAEGKEFSISYHGGDGNDVVLTELGHATTHALHHAATMSASDLLFA